MIKEQIDKDLKFALLEGDKKRTEILRGLKSAILYEEVAKNARDTGLSEEAMLVVIAREAKKRVESAQLYEKAGEQERANAELSEKKVIEAYLPVQLSDADLATIIDDVLATLGAQIQIGQAIGAVRQKVGPQADGARIAAAVRAKLQG